MNQQAGAAAERYKNLVRVWCPPAFPPGSSLYGGQAEWTWATAMTYRALADEEGIVVMPYAPAQNIWVAGLRQDEELRAFSQGTGYYAALLSLLTYSFGWTRPDKGLLWWAENYFPVEDQRFALIDAVWRRDETLLGFLGWLSSTAPSTLAATTLRPWSENVDVTELLLTPVWENKLRIARNEAPWIGGTDPLHLGDGRHISAPSQRASRVNGTLAPRLVGVDRGSRRADYIAETYIGWYRGLRELGSGLPKMPHGRNWRVQVFVQEVGYLGEYRRSQKTGLWFSGRHAFHEAGN